MDLTGKCKESFEEWYENETSTIVKLKEDTQEYYQDICFYDLEFEMQSGMYLEFFDSVDIKIEFRDYSDECLCCVGPYNIYRKSRSEAHKEAFKRANEIFNNL